MDLYKFINPLNILFLVSLISPYKVPYLVLYLTFPNLHAHFFSLYNFFASSLSLLLVPLLLQPLSSSPPRLCRDTANLINSVWASLSRVKSYPSRNLCIIPFKTVFLHRACMAISPTKQGFLWGKLRSREVSRRFWDETSHVAFIRRAKWREEEKEYQEAGWCTWRTFANFTFALFVHGFPERLTKYCICTVQLTKYADPSRNLVVKY